MKDYVEIEHVHGAGWRWVYVSSNSVRVCCSIADWHPRQRRNCIRSAKSFAKKLGCKVVDEHGKEL